MIVTKAAARVCLILGLAPAPALAATAGEGQASGPVTIVITPEWREQDLQSAPSTVEVLSNRQLDDAGVLDLKGLQYDVPGLVVRASGGAAEAVLRGVGSTLSVAGDSGVAAFTDGIYRNSAVHALQGLYDVERVEVVKGPHGVQLGRNVLGGAIGVVTMDPQPEASVYADLAYGNYDQREFRSALNLPIANSDLSFRLAGAVRQRNGYARNTFLNQDLDDLDSRSWRGKLRYRPSSDLDIVLLAETTRQEDSDGLAQQPDPENGVNAGILLGGRVSDAPRELTYNIAQRQHVHSHLYGLRLTRRTPNLEFRSLTAYQDTALDTTQDLDGTNVDFAESSPALTSRAFSQEFRLGSKPDLPVAWTVGLYYLHEDIAQQSDLQFPLAAVSITSASTMTNTAYAVFGDLSWSLTPTLRLRSGLRYSHERRRIDLAETADDPFGVLGTPGNTTLAQKAADNWDSMTPEVALLYTVSPNAFCYAKVARGFKSGGFNAYATQPSFDPESLWAYEMGIKTTLPRANLRINAALFYYDYADMQLFTLPPDSPMGGLPVIANAARASIYGADLALWYTPVPNLALHASATLLDAQFDEFDSIDFNNPGANPDHAGDPLPNAPDLSAVVGASYRWDLPGGGSLKLSSTYRYQSTVFFNPYHDPAVSQDGYGLLSASLGFESADGSWHIAVYGENLTDALYAENKIRVDPVVGTARHWGAPRTLGLRTGVRF